MCVHVYVFVRASVRGQVTFTDYLEFYNVLVCAFVCAHVHVYARARVDKLHLLIKCLYVFYACLLLYGGDGAGAGGPFGAAGDGSLC